MNSNENRVQAAIHYAVGKKCENMGEQNGLKYSKGFTALLAETVFEVGEMFAKDMESFAKHGKRSVINAEDVKLICRRNPELREKLGQCVKENNAEKQTSSKQKQKKRKSEFVDDDFDDDL